MKSRRFNFRPLTLAIGLVLTARAVAQPAPDLSSTSAVALARDSLRYVDRSSAPGQGVLTVSDDAFLDDLTRRGVQFFVDEQDPETGLMPDRSHADGGKSNDVASTASIGFGLTAMCIGDDRGWIPREVVYERATRVLTFLRDHGPQEHGHFFHFLDMHSGKRVWNCEVSNVDTALLMYGVLAIRQHFPGTQLAELANDLYENVDWPWLMKDDGTLYMGWKPEGGFLNSTWANFSEGPPLILLLGMGSKTHPLPAKVWQAWKREPVVNYAGLTFVQCPPLFTHQYPQCWWDLRGMRDDQLDYFRNSQLATIAQRQWTVTELQKRFSTYGENCWGLTASDFDGGYTAWGGPPEQGDIDGTVVPAAAAGSLAFEPRLCVDALKAMKAQYGEHAYRKYGFVDAFNPAKNWYNGDVIGIDIGPGVLMAENCRTGSVWKNFMSCPEAQTALKAAGFRPLTDADKASPANSMFKSKDNSSGGAGSR